MITTVKRDIDDLLEMAFCDLDKGENKEAAAAFIKYYIKYLKKNIRLAYKVGLGDLFNAACDSDGELDSMNDKLFELEDEADMVDIDELLNGLNREDSEEIL
jgi:hypothetical protein